MKNFLILFILPFLLWKEVSWSAGSANVNKNGVLLNGFDVVSYFAPAGAMQGRSEFQVQQKGVTYWFSSESNKQLFLKNPEKFEPSYQGWCAYAVADSKTKVEVDPKSFIIQDGKLLLFYDGFFGNTRDKWLHTKNKNPDAYLKQAETNWPSVQAKDN